MLDAHADEAFGDGNGVFGNELLEGDEEASLDSNAAGDGVLPRLRQYGAQRGMLNAHITESLLVRR
jgi:hypothetical protein